jgi:formate-dependent nitrite reductase membrane component NrfD
MSIQRILYLVLAVAGVVMTWYYNLQYLQESGGNFDVAAFMAAAATNAASKSLSWDLTIACLAGLLWIFFDLHHPRLWRRLCLCVSTVSVRAPGNTGVHAE